MVNNNKLSLINSFTQILKNNFIAFVLHLLLMIISIIFLIVFVSTGPKLGKYTTSIIGRIIIIILFISFYFVAGMLLDINNNKKYDFFTGVIIAVVGIGLWIYTISKTGISLTDTPEEVGEYWILYNLYYSPFTMIGFLLKVSNRSSVLSLLINFLPSIFFGLGIKYKRLNNS